MRGYYVDIIRGQRVSLLAGPFVTAAEALAIAPAAFALAAELDPFVHFDLQGTCAREADRVGVLNGRLGLPTVLTLCLPPSDGRQNNA